MNFIKLVLVQLKLNCKNIGTLIMLLVTPLFMVAAVNFTLGDSGGDNAAVPLLFINKDQGELGAAMLEKLDTADIMLENNLDDALVRLEKNEAVALYIIEEDFSALLQSATMPVIRSYQLEADAVIIFENEMKNFMQQQAKTALFQEQGIDYHGIENVRFIDLEMIRYEEREMAIDVNGLLPILMGMYFMFMTSSNIAMNLFKLKANNVLKRVLTTGNSNFTIIASFCASYFLLQTITTFFVFLIFDFVFGYDVGEPLPLFITIGLMSIISISLSVLMVRICKKEMLVSQVTTLVIIILFFAGMLVVMKDIFHLPQFVLVLAQLSPFYWAYEVLLFGNIFPSIPILVLIMLVFLTAGSLKLERFIQE